MGMSKWILLISAACLVSADCILWLIILDMYSMIQSKDEQLWIMNFDHVSCLFTFSWLLTFVHSCRYRLTHTIQRCWNEKLWILIMSAVCLLSADCLLLFMLADMDSLIQYKVLCVKNHEFWSCQLIFYFQLIVYFCSSLKIWTHCYDTKCWV